jgi:hypothetical protein
LAVRVTASTVTALGPPERSSAAAASSKRALERAGRGSVLPSLIVTHLPVWKRDYWSTYKTISLKTRPPPKGGASSWPIFLFSLTSVLIR